MFKGNTKIETKMKKNIRLFIFAFILLSFCTCTFFKKESLNGYIEKSCDFKKKDTSLVDLTGFVHEKIDYIFIFYPEIGQYEIAQAIGFDYNNDDAITDERRRIVIIGNGKILYEQEFWNNEFDFLGGSFEEFSNGKTKRNPYSVFINTKFKIKRYKTDNYYVLTVISKP